MFNYNWINIIEKTLLENWQYELTSETGGKYIVFEEEIIDSL